MPTIQKSDVIGAITVYLLNENRPCPAHYLTDKFGDDVGDVIAQLKKDGVIIGKRGRGGGIVFPDTVFVDKSKRSVKVINTTPISIPAAAIVNTDIDDSIPEMEEAPF